MAQKIILPPALEQHAHQFASSRGSKRGTPEYEKRFSSFLKEFYEETQVGRPNPSAEQVLTVQAFQDVFSSNGFLKKSKKSQVHKNQLASIIESLTNLYLEVQLGLRPHADRNYDKENADTLSSFELPKKKSGESDEAYEKRKRLSIENRYYRVLARTLIVESLVPFFNLEADAFISVIESAGLNEYKAEQLKGRGAIMTFIQAIRKNMDHVFQTLNIKAVLMQKEKWKKVS